MAARYWVGGTANWDATAGTKWALTSGGVGGQAVPTSSDDVFFDAASGAVTVTSTVGVSCLSINFTGFTGTFAGSTTFHIGGNVTLGSGMTSSFTGNFSIEVATATLRSNGISWLGNINLAITSGVYTLFDNWTVASLSSGGANAILNGNSLNVLGSITMTQNMASGTTNINLTGTGTWSGSGQLKNNLTINTAGTITISGTVAFNTGTLTYTAGTVVTTSSTLNIYASTTLNTNGITWNNITISNGTITNSNDLTLVGTLTLGATASVTINGSNVNAGGNLSLTGSGASIISGTSGIILNGTGTWSHSFTSTLQNNLTINTAGTITISGNVYYSTGTLTYTTGTVTVTSSTLNILGSSILSSTGINWNNVIIKTGTITLNSLLNINGTLTLASSSNVVFTGTSGFTVANLLCNTAGRTLTIKSSLTYTVNSSLILTGASGSKITIKSNTTSSAFFNLNPAATQSVTNTNATWIDSSGGKTIWTSAGTLSNTVNWSIGTGASGFYKFFAN